MKKIGLFLFIFLSINIFSQEIEIEKIEDDVDIVLEDNHKCKNDACCEKYWTYIPLDPIYKDAIYWPIKSVAMGITLGYSLVIVSTPFLDINNSFRRDVYSYFAYQCHQDTSRSFCVHTSHGEDQFPLCSRCTGIYFGFFTGTLDSFIWDSFQIKNWERWQQGLLHVGTYSLLTLPLIIDGFVQYNTDYVSNNGWRFVTGVLFGHAISAIIDECVQLVLDYDFKNRSK